MSESIEAIKAAAQESARLYVESGLMAGDALAELHLGRMDLGRAALLLAEISALSQQTNAALSSNLAASQEAITHLESAAASAHEATGSSNKEAAQMHTSTAEALAEARGFSANTMRAHSAATNNPMGDFTAVQQRAQQLMEGLQPAAEHLAALQTAASNAAEAARSYGNNL